MGHWFLLKPVVQSLYLLDNLTLFIFPMSWVCVSYEVIQVVILSLSLSLFPSLSLFLGFSSQKRIQQGRWERHEALGCYVSSLFLWSHLTTQIQ